MQQMTKQVFIGPIPQKCLYIFTVKIATLTTIFILYFPNCIMFSMDTSFFNCEMFALKFVKKMYTKFATFT